VSAECKELEVTPEMLKAGALVLLTWIDDMPSYFCEQVAAEVYRAMQSSARLKETVDY
jgi:hypothetical protein